MGALRCALLWRPAGRGLTTTADPEVTEAKRALHAAKQRCSKATEDAVSQRQFLSQRLKDAQQLMGASAQARPSVALNLAAPRALRTPRFFLREANGCTP